jgi:hypothetical protein
VIKLIIILIKDEKEKTLRKKCFNKINREKKILERSSQKKKFHSALNRCKNLADEVFGSRRNDWFRRELEIHLNYPGYNIKKQY